MTALDFAVEMAFTDPNISQPAWYRDQTGQYREVRVIVRRPDETVTFGAGRLLAETTIADLQVCDISEPQAGETILIGEESFIVQGSPRRESARLVWRMELIPE